MITKEELEKRIDGYLERARRGEVRLYPLEEEDTYRIMSGSKTYGRDEIALVMGRFIDALICAVQRPEFVGDWCGWIVPDNCNHGYIEKAKIIRLDRERTSRCLVKNLKGGRIK